MQQAENSSNSSSSDENMCVLSFGKLCGTGGKTLEKEWGVAAVAPEKHQNPGFHFSFISAPVNQAKLEDILKTLNAFYGNQPFELWIDESNKAHIESIQKGGYSLSGIYPSRFLDLDKKFSEIASKDIELKHIVDEKDLKDWVAVVASSKGLNGKNLENFVKNIFNNPNVFFYVAYYQGKPIASRLMIVYGKIVSGYFSITLPAYRQKGIGSLLLRFSLNQMIDKGVKKYTILAIPHGSNVWRKMGIKQGREYICFEKKAAPLGSVSSDKTNLKKKRV